MGGFGKRTLSSVANTSSKRFKDTLAFTTYKQTLVSIGIWKEVMTMKLEHAILVTRYDNTAATKYSKNHLSYNVRKHEERETKHSKERERRKRSCRGQVSSKQCEYTKGNNSHENGNAVQYEHI